MIAHDRGTSHRIADKERRKDKAHVHDDAVYGNTVGTGKAHELPVVEHVYDGHGDVRHKLGSAVCTGLQQGTKVHMGPSETESAPVWKDKVEQGDQSADGLTDRHCGGRPHDAETQNSDKISIEDHVCKSCRDGDQESELRAFRNN